MKHPLPIAFILLAALAISACRSGTGTASRKDTTAVISDKDKFRLEEHRADSAIKALTACDSGSIGKELKVYCQYVEDIGGDCGGKLMIVEFPERHTRHGFRVRYDLQGISDIDVRDSEGRIIKDGNDLMGKFINLRYKTEMVSFVSDIYTNGVSIHGIHDKPDPKCNEFTGILGGAKEVTGDNDYNPHYITVTDKQEKKMKFEYTIDENVVAVNNQPVTVFYTQHIAERLIDIQVVK